MMSLEEYTSWLTVERWIQQDQARATANGAERLLAAVEAHMHTQAHALDRIGHIGSTSADPVIALVMRLILEDDRQHQILQRRIASSMRNALNWTASPDDLPPPSLPDGPISTDLITSTRTAVEEKRSAARSRRQLAQRCTGINGGLVSVLLEMMAADSENHARLLEFVGQRLKSRRTAAHTAREAELVGHGVPAGRGYAG
jgi:hypothetical protein